MCFFLKPFFENIQMIYAYQRKNQIYSIINYQCGFDKYIHFREYRTLYDQATTQTAPCNTEVVRLAQRI